MTTLLLSHAGCLAHDMGAGHPERPDRLRAVLEGLSAPVFDGLRREEGRPVAREAVLRVHPEAYLAALEAASPDSGLVALDADTAMGAATLDAVWFAAGSAVRLVDAVMRAEAQNGFAATRPPGHHAERAKPMGFCFVNQAAIAARHAQAAHGAERVAIVDFDVHHGNGTQEIFWTDASVLYASTHEMPLFPGTGARSERGEHGTIVNAPLQSGDGSLAFREAFETTILPRLKAFAPDLLILSAGFDAHWRDPLANINLTDADFGWVTGKLIDVAERTCDGRVVSLLEGGYDLKGLRDSAVAHVKALMGMANGDSA